LNRKLPRRLFSFFLILPLSFAVFAQTGFAAELDAGTFCNVTIPTASYLKTYGTGENAIQLPAVRPQLSFAFDVNPGGMYIGNFRFTLGFSGLYTTSSASYSSTYLRSFIAMGGNLKLALDFSRNWSLWTKGRVLVGRYRPFNSYFLISDAELAVSYRIISRSQLFLAVSVPVGVSFRKDMIVPRAGIVLSLGFRGLN